MPCELDSEEVVKCDFGDPWPPGYPGYARASVNSAGLSSWSTPSGGIWTWAIAVSEKASTIDGENEHYSQLVGYDGPIKNPCGQWSNRQHDGRPATVVPSPDGTQMTFTVTTTVGSPCSGTSTSYPFTMTGTIVAPDFSGINDPYSCGIDVSPANAIFSPGTSRA